MKRILNSLLFLMVIGLMIVPVNVRAKAKLDQVKISSFTRTAKSSIQLTWDKVNKANCYEVYMKEGNGKFRKVAVTKRKTYEKAGLKIGKAYCFKIRACRNIKGKKKYGKFSSTVRKNMKEYEYLVDVAEPYYKNYTYDEYKGALSQLISGEKYYNGFACYKCANDIVAIWNLAGKYSRIAFTYGNQDINKGNTPGSCSVLFKGDDEVLQELQVGAYDMAKNCEINIEGIQKFSIEIATTDAYACDYFAMGNIKLYY